MEIHLDQLGTLTVFGSFKEEDKEVVGSWSLEYGSLGYLVEYLEGNDSTYF